ncbi:MAG: hypothetical protein J0M19_01950 [Sphingomonadales bacterium]|nr:hypothetical protein [Sphingomonadales bacterium]
MRDQFCRLASDTSGNVGLIVAVSVIPLLALIGGGLDMSRAYMANTQLQSACDAGVLAGRRAMGKSGVYEDDEKAKAQKLFNFNFDAQAINATGVSFVTSSNDQGQVTGTAKANVPTVVMKIFNKEKFDLQADCMAELQVANTDVMFVLDTTGSMAGSRITGLREAVKDFHKTMNEAVTADDTRVRYGFVPYSTTVNAKGLLADPETPMPVDYFADTAAYQSREAQFNTPVYVGTTVPVSTVDETYATKISSSNCTKYGQNKYPSSSGANPVVTGSAPGPVTQKSYTYKSWGGATGTTRWCVRTVKTTLTTYVTKYAFTKWRYKEVALDASSYKTGASVAVGTGITTPSGSIVDQSENFTYANTSGYYDMVTMAKKNGTELRNVGITNMTWGGCLEERDTVDDSDWSPIPDEAHDLDITSAPTSNETRWRAQWNGLTYNRSNKTYVDSTSNYSTASYACPAQMKLFTEVELSDDPTDVPDWLDTYLNGLTPAGNTYHDIGMIWGARLANPRGIFEENVTDGDKAVSRHLIFMSDGQLEPYIWGYNAYGIEVLSNRIAPLGSDENVVKARHASRFLAACEEAKAQGITVWVIAFGTTLNNDMKACSSDGRAYSASDTTALKQQFKFIASQVANLRLGQ